MNDQSPTHSAGTGLEKTAFDYDSIPMGYYDEVFHKRKGVQSKWHHLEYARVAREVPTGTRLVDIACGPGTFISTLPDSVICTGLDVAQAQVDYANRRYGTPNKHFQTMTPGRLDFPDNSVDIITSTELIEHITEDECTRLLKECSRVLKPSGKIILTTPNYSSCWPVLEWCVNRLSKLSYEHQHITHYNALRLRSVMENAGFEVLTTGGFQFSAWLFAAISWNLADFVERIEPAFLKDNLGNLLIGVGRLRQTI